jgi:hypothetical protein
VHHDIYYKRDKPHPMLKVVKLQGRHDKRGTRGCNSNGKLQDSIHECGHQTTTEHPYEKLEAAAAFALLPK